MSLSLLKEYLRLVLEPREVFLRKHKCILNRERAAIREDVLSPEVVIFRDAFVFFAIV